MRHFTLFLVSCSTVMLPWAASAQGRRDQASPRSAEATSTLSDSSAPTSNGHAACGTGERRYLLVTFSGFSADERTEIVQHLAAGLRGSGIDVCRDASSRRAQSPIATMNLGHGPSGVSVEIDDSLTNKRVARDLPRAGERPGAYVVAAAADELLRATWAELSLRHPPTETTDDENERPAPPATERSLTTDPHDSSEVTAAPTRGTDSGRPCATPNDCDATQYMSFEPTAAHHAGGVTWFGFDLGYGVETALHVLEARVGYRRGLEEPSRTAPIEVEGIELSGTYDVNLLSPGNFRLGPRTVLAAEHGWFRGERPARRDAAAEAVEVSGWAAYLRAGFFAAWGAGPWFARANFVVGAPLLGFEVTDQGAATTGLSGVEWGGGVGLGWRLPR